MDRGRHFTWIALCGGSLCVWGAWRASTDQPTQQPAAHPLTLAASASPSPTTYPPVAKPDVPAPSAPDATIEVKTAGEELLVAQKYTDGQATAPATVATAPAAATVQPAQPEAQPAYEADAEPASPVTGTPSSQPAGEQPANEQPAAKASAPTVHTDYMAAMQEAAEDRKMLFIYFHEIQPNAAQQAFDTLTLSDGEIQEKLKRYVVARLPRDAKITVDGQPVKLLEHPAFAEMLGRQGVAVVDLVHERSDFYGHVVSTFPFTPGKYYRKQALSIILDLPPGTLTQRTMIFAVRIHPEAPASTQGVFHTVLADEAKDHANYQAAILVQGHHSWDARFQRINAKLPSGVMAQEVVAESWPNESLVEAAVDCVHSWRQSPGHWGAVHSRHPLFGYDIKRGRNGIWYATGIFGRR